ncbi:ATP phosphoribosyltransferase regulatory subunit, partial [Acinetobacter baumannii]
MTSLQSIRGFNDILPAEAAVWSVIETTLRQLARLYDYAEIRLPIVEKTELFVRTVGEVTDIV